LYLTGDFSVSGNASTAAKLGDNEAGAKLGDTGAAVVVIMSDVGELAIIEPGRGAVANESVRFEGGLVVNKAGKLGDDDARTGVGSCSAGLLGHNVSASPSTWS